MGKTTLFNTKLIIRLSSGPEIISDPLETPVTRDDIDVAERKLNNVLTEPNGVLEFSHGGSITKVRVSHIVAVKRLVFRDDTN